MYIHIIIIRVYIYNYIPMKWIELVGFPVNPPLNAWNHHQPPIESHLNPIKPPWDYHFFALLDPHPKTSATTRCSQGCQVAGSTSWPPAVRCPPSPAFRACARSIPDPTGPRDVGTIGSQEKRWVEATKTWISQIWSFKKHFGSNVGLQ